MAYALGKGYTSWEAAPEPLRGYIEAAVEVRVFRRWLFRSFWRGEEPPKRYDGVAELSRRYHEGLGIEPEAVEQVPSLEAIRQRYKADGVER